MEEHGEVQDQERYIHLNGTDKTRDESNHENRGTEGRVIGS